jgi:SagB-type dehydrogenase family enzyme
LDNSSEVIAWRERAGQPDPEADAVVISGERIILRTLAEGERPADPIEEVIVRRGSSRRFTGGAISFGQLSTLLASCTGGVSADFTPPDGVMMNDVYLIVNAVDGLGPGSYVFHPGRGALERLQAGDFRRHAGQLALGQALAADASVNVYFLMDLERVLERQGNRGYRAAQLEAAIMAGKMYLAAYAMRFGATGLTFFDDYVTEFFSPHAAGKSVMFLIALGVPARRGT